MVVKLTATGSAKYYGSGAGSGTASKLSMTGAEPHVTNTEFFAPTYYSSDGYGALVASDLPFTPSNIASYPAKWQSAAGTVTWTVEGTRLDIYLTPGDHPTSISSLWSLTGRPAVVPRYAFGFMVRGLCRAAAGERGDTRAR